MDRFPSEFADLLNRRGRRLFDDLPHLETLIAKRQTPIVVLDNVLDEDVARDCIRLLDEGMYPHLKRLYRPVPREALTGMKENYEEELPKTVKVRTATFHSPKSKVLEAARAIGARGHDGFIEHAAPRADGVETAAAQRLVGASGHLL